MTSSNMRGAAWVAVLAGAAGSLALTLRTGRHNHSLILMLLFALWAPSPFVALGLAHRAAPRWRPFTQLTLYTLTLILAVVSLAVYAEVAFGPPRQQPAAMFLLIPLASWMLMAIAIPAAARLSRR